MRIYSAFALFASALALSACGGGSSDMVSGVNGLSLNCDLSQTTCGQSTTPTTPTPTPTGPGTAAGGGAAGGNDADIDVKTGDTAMVMESGKLVLPESGTSLAKLSATNAEVLGATKPTSISYDIDTNTASNSAWAVSRPMTEYQYGSNHVDAWDTGNRGGSSYREYRLATNEVATQRDDLLQLWAWTDTYATHYRNAIAQQDSWSFGGNKTLVTSMPTGGTATYTGRYVGTATTDGFVVPPYQPIDPNADWRVQGSSVVNANFATGAVTGLITPETWTQFNTTLAAYFTQNTNGNYYINDTLAGNSKNAAANLVISGNDYGVIPYFPTIYDTQITLAGAITGNSYQGTATLSAPWATGTSVMYGGFFGPTATETTGVFDAYGTAFDPIGGATGLNGDRRAHIDIRGAFHGTCTPGVSCAP